MTKNIAYFCVSKSWGGLEMNQLKNANWMKIRGHRVFIMCQENSPIYHEAVQNKIETILINSNKRYFDFKQARNITKLIDQYQIQYLILRDSKDLNIAVLVKKRTVIKLHLSYFMEMQLGKTKKNLFQTIRFSQIDLWICPLEYLKHQVLTMTYMNPKKVLVIPSGIQLIDFEQKIDQKQARQLLELPEDKKIIGLIGRFDYLKGQMLLIQALQLLNDADVCVCLMGEPTKNEGELYMNSILDLIKNENLAQRVFIRPFRNDVVPFYKAIDVFVMASKSETFGMVTIEAMACGTPIIGSHAGGTPEILENGKLGDLFESMNAESLKNKILEFFKSKPNNVDQLKNAAKKYDHNTVCALVEKALNIL